MSYALLGNLPPIMGLYAATIAGYVYTLLGSSGQLTIGPVALVGRDRLLQQEDHSVGAPRRIAVDDSLSLPPL